VIRLARVEPSKDWEGFLNGEKLYGDDFDLPESIKWLDDEKEAYANLWARDRRKYQYSNHAIDVVYGFSRLPRTRFWKVLEYGGAWGDEVEPILPSITQLTIVEPSDAFVLSGMHRIPITYVKPRADCALPFQDNSFDLITCFSTLHHVPKVTKVIGEFYRCLSPGGYLLIREPTVSMGDWRLPRRGLTPRERGIPLPIFRNIIDSFGFSILKEQRCMFSITGALRRWLKTPLYNSLPIVVIDSFFCLLFSWNNSYHPTTFLRKLGPTSVFFVLQKPLLR
jgi:SAM-dependent methyltransferase